MKGDFSRDTFRAKRSYSSVRLQQGRVPMDADFNNNEDIHRYIDRTEGTDVIGGCGTPASESGFQISFAGGRFQIAQGRYYVDGILAENPALTDFAAQPDFPGQVDPAAGTQFFYLDVWEEHVTALDDPLLREVALNGPDTATCLRVVWQVRAVGVAAGSTCSSAFAGLAGPTDATLRARAKTPDDTEACTVKPGSNYRRLQNQLYRVEVHDAGNLGAATFKWSRENGSIVTGFTVTAPRILTVASVGRDQMLSFASGNAIEITDRRRELLGLPGDFFKVTRVDGNNLFLDAAGPAVVAGNYGSGAKVRRWDSDGPVHFANLDADGYMALEDGVQVLIAGTDFRSGDYWMIPARTVTGDVEWPKTGAVPDALPPHGIKHHFCPLAVAVNNAGAWTISDCRNPFVPLTKVIALYYLGGDGQTATPNPLAPAAYLPLDAKPTVGVSRGKVPVSGANVLFTILSGGGRIVGSATVTTGPNGIAQCDWQLGSTVPVQQLKAELLDNSGNPTHLPVTFTATLNTADRVAYTPGCSDLEGVITVQDALDALCARGDRSCCRSVGAGGDYETIEQAAEDLLRQGVTGFCLCFLPGVHVWPPAPFAGTEDLSVTLTGVRGAARVVADQGLKFEKLQVLAVRDLVITSEGAISIDKVDRMELSFIQVRQKGSLDIKLVQTATISSSEVEIVNGALFLGGISRLDVRDLDAKIEPEGDALRVERCESVCIENCRIVASLSTPKHAAVRLGAIEDLTFENNHVRAQVDPKEPKLLVVDGLDTIGIAPFSGVAGEILSVGHSGPGQPMIRLMKKLADASPAERVNIGDDIGNALTDGYFAMTGRERRALLAVRRELAVPNPDIHLIEAALNEIVIDPVAPSGEAAAPKLSGGQALAIDDGMGIYRVEGNILQGFVGLYGRVGTDRITPAVARRIDAAMKGVKPFGLGALHFTNNETFSILLGETFTSNAGTGLEGLLNGKIASTVFRRGHIAHNSFLVMPIEVLFGALVMADNTFAPLAGYGGIAIASHATYTGNNASRNVEVISATTAMVEAGNLHMKFV